MIQVFLGKGYIGGFQAGYKAAQAKQKQFSLEDIKKAIEMAREQSMIGTQLSDGMEFDYTEEEIIQSLSTKQLPKEFILDKGDTIEEQIKNGHYVY